MQQFGSGVFNQVRDVRFGGEGAFLRLGSIRLNSCKRPRYEVRQGVDLSNHEVKSAENGGSYEYQYHKLTGKEKLRFDMQKGHLFFDHSNHLRNVDLRYASGDQLAEFFRVWLDDYPDPYPGQRHRKNIPFSWVKKNGVLLMKLRDGEVEYPELRAAGGKAFKPSAKE